MIRLRCPVRGCGEALLPQPGRLACARGHAFDRAREGYWNLLQPQDRRSPRAGDTPAAVAARQRFLAGGRLSGLVEALGRIADRLALPAAAAVLDAGCGEGTILAGLAAGRGWSVCGVDLSARAVRLAARRLPGGIWIVANADRALPLPDGSIDLVLSLFGRRNGPEFARVLRDGGFALVATPGADDLIELREIAQGRGERRDRGAPAERDLGPGLALLRRETWRETSRLDRAAIDDALAMTYRGARQAERARLAGIESLSATLSADLLLFRR